MLSILVHNKSQSMRRELRAGSLDFGRRDRPGQDRVVIQDPFVSRDHLRLAEVAEGRVVVECLSETKPVLLNRGEVLRPGERRELDLPVRLQIGYTRIEVVWEAECPPPSPDSSCTILQTASGESETQRLSQLGESPAPVTLARWFETLLRVQQAAVGSTAFFAETARAVVELIGLDRGLVVLRQGAGWQIEAETGESGRSGFSRTVVQSVLARKQTVMLTPEVAVETSSLHDVEAVVAAPIFDPQGDVVGIVYGSRDSRSAAAPVCITPLEAQVVQVLAAIVGTGLGRVQKEVEAAEARARLEQFASPELARELCQNPHLLEGAEREITVLFCDLRGFSRIAERLGAANTYWLLGDVMDRLTECVFSHQGVIVDYFGDGLCAMWNAPLDQPDHADRACRTAQDMLRFLPSLDQHWKPLTGDYFHLGIGIHTGTALVGNAGSRRRMKFGPRGHCVNLASRVEGVTKHLDVPIVLTGATRQQLRSSFSLRRLCRARMAGVEETVDLYELSAPGESPAWSRLRDTYEAALRHYELAEWPTALAILEQIGSDAELLTDGATDALRRRVQTLLQEPPAAFAGIWEFESK